jgi:carbonic anhydrase
MKLPVHKAVKFLSIAISPILVVHTDANMLSVLEFAVKYLHVNHIIVCGHYGCSGIKSSMTNTCYGFVDNWLAILKMYIINTGKSWKPLLM